MYFFCKRGRKYRNSIRPNRVTGSGFWKATGIDKPIYSITAGKPNDECIGLKKSLVYYRGCAGKGTKTDWMMHEFRLPLVVVAAGKNPDHHLAKENIAQEAEVWTLCRIFKRNASYKKYIPADCSRLNTIKRINLTDSGSKTCSLEESDNNNNNTQSPSFSLGDNSEDHQLNLVVHQLNSVAQPLPVASTAAVAHAPPFATAGAHTAIWSSGAGEEEYLRDGNWDELRSVVDLVINDPTHLYHCR